MRNIKDGAVNQIRHVCQQLLNFRSSEKIINFIFVSLSLKARVEKSDVGSLYFSLYMRVRVFKCNVRIQSSCILCQYISYEQKCPNCYSTFSIAILNSDDLYFDVLTLWMAIKALTHKVTDFQNGQKFSWLQNCVNLIHIKVNHFIAGDYLIHFPRTHFSHRFETKVDSIWYRCQLWDSQIASNRNNVSHCTVY